jgi:hypothetical protein
MPKVHLDAQRSLLLENDIPENTLGCFLSESNSADDTLDQMMLGHI